MILTVSLSILTGTLSGPVALHDWDYLNNMLDPEKDNNSKKSRKYIKSRKQDTMGIGTLKNNGVLAETAEQKAEMLNSQFTSVFTTENTTNMTSKGNSPFKPMKDIKISEKGVEKELNRLNPCKATGPDKVPVRILKGFLFCSLG
jgi:hypothetical protein